MILALFVVLLVLFVVLPLAGLALWWLVSTAVVGVVVGGLGRLIVPGYQPIGVLATIVIGLVGSMVGGGIGRAIDVGWLPTVLLQVGAAALLVVGWTRVAGTRTLSGPRRPLP